VAGEQDNEGILLLEVEGSEIFECVLDVVLGCLVVGKQARLRHIVAAGLGYLGQGSGKAGDVGNREP